MRVFTLLLMIPALTLAQDSAPAPIQHIQAELTSTLKLAKLKEGAAIQAQTVAPVQLTNGPSIPAGSTVLGRVLSVDSNGLSVVFDEALLGGKRAPLAITLTGLAWMGGGKQMSMASGSSQLDSPSGGSLPNDHALNGGPYSVTEAGGNAVRGVSHESLAEVNAKPADQTAKRGPGVAAHAGTVIGMPGLKLSVGDAAPFSSRLDFETKERQLPKGMQLMFSVRSAN